LIASGNVEMIDSRGSVVTKAPVSASSVTGCAPGQPAALEPAVSASDDKVYFRDGDTTIRSLSLTGQTEDVTTVPGGPTTVSFFSVSPDDQQVAVLVEDLSSLSTIRLVLYVENLRGGANHTVLYRATTTKDLNGITLWLMGWHAGGLVFQVMPACPQDPVNAASFEWHIVDISTGVWILSIGGRACTMSRWPAPTGVACVDLDPTTPDYMSYTGYNWNGSVDAIGSIHAGEYQSGRPLDLRSYSSVFLSTRVDGTVPSATRAHIQPPDTGEVLDATVQGHAACLWIDGNTLLAPDAVITIQPQGVVQLPAVGVCAGHYPGGL
jgi:hypothetical protein